MAHTADGRTVFVRGSLPGELVDAVVDSTTRGGRVVFATATVVSEPSEHRVEPPCGYAGRCGGCDFQHVELGYQRRLKEQVIIDQLSRIGRIAEVGGVPLPEAVTLAPADDEDGLRWRTRVSVAVTDGRAGFHEHRSDRVVPVSDCLTAVDGLTPVFAREWPGASAVTASVGEPGGYLVEPPVPGHDPDAAGELQSRAWVRHSALGREWRVNTDGFWQAHVAAPELLVAAVRRALRPQPTDALVDLYSGVGLFAGALAAEVGSVDAVEGDPRAVSMARRNLHDLPSVAIHQAPVGSWLTERLSRSADEEVPPVDLVVLDPPRVGAQAAVVEAIAELAPRRIAYVACDVAALARDLRHFGDLGWRLDTLACLDIFPMTAHVEAIAGLVPTQVTGP